jgi:hypothetical protein
MKLDDYECEKWFKDSGLEDKNAAYQAWTAGLKYERVGCVRLASSVWDSMAESIAKMIRLRGHERKCSAR